MEIIFQYKKEMQVELDSILSWWERMTVDNKNGGFIGKIDHANNIDFSAAKGAVLNSRILWAFSSAYNHTARNSYLKTAERAFEYIIEHFIDRDFGGVYWTVDFKGAPLDLKKQIYAQAFAIYGLSEYYAVSKNELARENAIAIYRAIVRHSYDERFRGYVEALTRDWKETENFRLSDKDENEKKSMNTHLHLLEAFANLYKVWEDEELKKRILELIRIFLDHVIEKKNHHLVLFFDEEWKPRPGVISYGHDIEAAWLIQESAKRIDEKALLEEIKKISIKIAIAAAKGLDKDGGLWYEYDVRQDHLVDQKHWWPQAEAMIGFFNAWQITGDQKFLQQSLQSWKFVKDYMLDKNGGEWYWGVNADHTPMTLEDKVGIWKCPYHNSRACMEIIDRIDRGLNTEK